MQTTKDLLLRIVEVKARHRVAGLASAFVRAASRDREMILAEMQFERWLADSCRDCQLGSLAASVGLGIRVG